MIQREILIEDLVTAVPGAATYLMEHGIRCIACGEPIWGTLESAAQEKGFTDAEIERFLGDLSAMEKARQTQERNSKSLS